MGRDVAEQVQRMGSEAGMMRTGFYRAVGKAPRLVELAEPQTSATPATEPGALSAFPLL